MSPRRVAVARVLASYTCAAVAAGLPWPLLVVLVHEQYAAPLLVGLVASARMLPYVLLSWASGRLGDRWQRDRLVRACLGLRLLCLALGGVLVACGAVLPGVVAASLAVAVGTPVYPTLVAALPRLAGEDAPSATRLLVACEVSAWVVGPALGGLLLTPALRGWTMPLAIALAASALVLARGLRLPTPCAAVVASDAEHGVLGAVRRCPQVIGGLVIAGLLNVSLGAAALVLLPLTHGWGQDDSGFGVATAWLGFGALGAPLLWRLRRTPGLAVIVAAFALVALTPVPVVALPLLGIAGACGVIVEGRVTETIQLGVPDRHRAGAVGLADTVMVGSALLGSLSGPLLAAGLGARPAMGLVALVCLLPCAPILVARMRDGRESAAPKDEFAPALSRVTGTQAMRTPF